MLARQGVVRLCEEVRVAALCLRSITPLSPKMLLAASSLFVLDSVDAVRAPSYGTVSLRSHMHCPFTLLSAQPSSPTGLCRHSVERLWRVAPDTHQMGQPCSLVRTSRAATNLERARGVVE